ncbi:MAG: ester cyclase [bacterium]
MKSIRQSGRRFAAAAIAAIAITGASAFACAWMQAPASASEATEANARIVREFVEKVYNEGKLELIEKYIAPDFIDSSPGAPPDARGPAFVREQAIGTFALFPDLKFKNEDVIAEGDRVVVRWSSTSSFTGTAGGVKGDGRPVTVSGISIMRIADGMIAESWDIVDRMAMFTQMGFTLEPPKEGAE